LGVDWEGWYEVRGKLGVEDWVDFWREFLMFLGVGGMFYDLRTRWKKG
jgi:hypothetical protein